MTIIPDRLDLTASLRLSTGAHDEPDLDGLGDLVDVHACVMEAVAFVAGEPWSDHPQCASSTIGAYLRAWNDSLPDDDRQQLKQYIPRLVGSAGTPEQEDRRAWMAADWLIRVHTPAWLRLAGLTSEADALAGLPELVSADSVPSLKGPLEAARKNAAAAWDAAGDAAWGAARAAAWGAAGDAARDAARAAARAALAPTVTELQQSSHELVDRMLAVTSS